MTGAPRTACEMSAALARGETLSSTLVEAALAGVSRWNDAWHVFITVTADTALEAARHSDERRRSGFVLSPLDGIPVAVKDNIDVAEVPTTDGTAFYGDRIAKRDAFVVRRLKEAGAVIIGKLNMHEGALGATTDNPFWGRCENPRFPGLTPGGSSGGSGAAVAGGLVPIALGTDTMGSVRIPAAYCGVWGLKPTRGLVSSTGLSQLSWTLDTIGPLARSADDLALAISVMAGNDPTNPDDGAAPDCWCAGREIEPPANLLIGRPAQIERVECEAGVIEAYEEVLKRLSDLGAKVRDIDIPEWRPDAARRAGLLVSEAEAGSRIGPDLDRDERGFSSDFRQMIDFGRNVAGSSLAAAYRHLHVVGFAFRRALETVDLIALPTAPQRAFRHDRPAPVNQADFTAIANIAGCPAIALPVPARDEDRPFSVQFVGRPHSEFLLISAAAAAGVAASRVSIDRRP